MSNNRKVTNMMTEKIKRSLEWAVTAYRAEMGAWPACASELARFSFACGHDVHFDSFHTLHFKSESSGLLHLECVFAPGEDGWAESATLTLEAQERVDGLVWRTRCAWGSLRRVEAISFCEKRSAYRSAV